jgi:hypothetical protein
LTEETIIMPPKVRVKIPVHVLVYSIGFMPAAAYGEFSATVINNNMLLL